jgi:hypothetical protein
MVTGVIAAYKANGVPVNEPKQVAEIFMHTISNDGNGEAFYVSGGKTYEIEKSLDNLKPQWLRQHAFDELMAGQQALGGVSILSTFRNS